MSIVNPNMDQIQNFLKKLSPQEWTQFVQNPSPQVPSLLIGMESERRNKEAKEQQNALAQAPTGTVINKVNSEAASLGAPSMGLGSLPPTMMAQAPVSQAPRIPQAPVNMAEGGLAQLDTGDMYNEANFATGGIVAFSGEEGSYVGNPDGSYADELGIYQSGLSDTDTELQKLLKAQDLRASHRPGSRNPNAPLVFQGRDQSLRPMALEGQYPTTQDLSSKIAELQAQKTGYQSGVKSYGDLIKAGITNAGGPATDTKTQGKPAADRRMSDTDLLKAANTKYNTAADKITADQGSSYDKAIERLMSIYKEEDPARAEMKAEYQKKKGNALYDYLGDIGYGLSQAKKGREFEAAGAGLSRAQARADALTKEGKDLKLEDMKAQRELKLIGAKYGFDSEQFKEKLNATRELEKAKMGNELEKANIIYGYKAKGFDSAQLAKQDKYVKDWLSSEGKAYAPYLTADENAKGISDKMKSTIIAAKKAHAAKKAEAATRFNTMTGYGPAGFAGFDPNLYQVTPVAE
jgi:hypothetical protein